MTLDLPVGTIGGTVQVMALGVGDGDEPATASATVDGRSVAPPSPVHLHLTRDTDGAAVLHWTRRSRAGWHWVDRVDAALGEEVERYVVSTIGGATLAEVQADAVSLADLGTVDPATLEVRQVGTLARSHPTRLIEGPDP